MKESAAPARVLVVDDSPTIRSLVRKTLGLHEYEVVEAEDGVDALGVLAQDQAFSLLIVDLVMPRVDGISLIHQIRTGPFLEGVPILVLSGETLGPDQVPIPGSSAFLAKPFTPSVLLQTVRALLEGVG